MSSSNLALGTSKIQLVLDTSDVILTYEAKYELIIKLIAEVVNNS
jgi:hypothetical protein